MIAVLGEDLIALSLPHLPTTFGSAQEMVSAYFAEREPAKGEVGQTQKALWSFARGYLSAYADEEALAVAA